MFYGACGLGDCGDYCLFIDVFVVDFELYVVGVVLCFVVCFILVFVWLVKFFGCCLFMLFCFGICYHDFGFLYYVWFLLICLCFVGVGYVFWFVCFWIRFRLVCLPIDCFVFTG